MTKILYVPTGEFIIFNSEEKFLSETVLENINEYSGSAEGEIECLLAVTPNEYNIRWAETNKIIFPILREELEIIYD